MKAQGLPPNAISLVVNDPEKVADEVAAELIRSGFPSFAIKGVMPEVGNKFALVKSDAFESSLLAFRRHILAMGKPPHQRRLT